MRNVMMIVGLSAFLMSGSAYAAGLHLKQKVTDDKCISLTYLMQNITNHGDTATEIKPPHVADLLAKFSAASEAEQALGGDEIVVATQEGNDDAHVFFIQN